MSNSCCKLQFSLYHKIIPHFIYAEEGLFITWGNLIFQNLISIWLKKKIKNSNAEMLR